MTPRPSLWSSIHPNSVGAQMLHHRWVPLFHLVWLFWMVSAPWLVAHGDTRVIVLTFLSLPVFLVLYWRAWYDDRRRIGWNALAIAVLGLAMIPVNSSWSYLIYAAVIIPYCTTPRGALAWLAALMAVFSALALLCDYPTVVLLSAITMCVALSLFSLFSALSQRRSAELRLSHDEVRRLAATAERERIGRDLHDLLGHTLSLIAIKGELARRLFDRDPAQARHEVGEIERIAREALAEVRSAVTGIRAAGLAAELASAKLLLQSSGLELEERCEDLPLAPPVESALALCLREAVTNVQRHARATRVEIRLRRDQVHAVLQIGDNGRGGATLRGNGLAGIEERLRAVRGSLLIESPPGRGTQLSLRVPLAARSAVADSSAAARAAA